DRWLIFGSTVCNMTVHDDLVFAADTEGYVDCLDAWTGKRYWTYDAQSSITATPLIVDGKVYIATENGDVAVLALSRELKVLAVNELDNGINSGCVFANDVLYLATKSRLYAIKSDRTDDHSK